MLYERPDLMKELCEIINMYPRKSKQEVDFRFYDETIQVSLTNFFSIIMVENQKFQQVIRLAKSFEPQFQERNVEIA